MCSLNLEETEIIRNDIDFLFNNNEKIFDQNNYLKNNYFIESNFRKISKNLVLNVVKARLDEIFEILKKQLIVPGFNINSGISLLLIGDGSKLLNIDKYCENFFKLNAKKIDLSNIDSNVNFEKNFVSSLGALKIIKDGWETEAIPEIVEKNIKKIGFFAKIFGNR